jgi:hypothetical protein
MNDVLFKPHGLVCMIMSFKPQSKPSAEVTDISKTIDKVNLERTGAKKFIYSMRNEDGSTRSEAELPEAAPLIFPDLDALSIEEKTEAIQNKKTGTFMAEYYDRRAQATYNKKNPASKLAVTPEPQFVSRYADPNHPASSGSLIGLVTGGHVDMGARQALRGQRRAQGGRSPSRKQERAMSNAASGMLGASKREHRQRNPGSGGRGGPLKLVKKVLTQDVFYVLVTNLPTQEEVESAQPWIDQMEPVQSH